MKSGIVKRSVNFGGHKTSVTLEDQFWNALHEIAQRREIRCRPWLKPSTPTVRTVTSLRPFVCLCLATIRTEEHGGTSRNRTGLLSR